MALETFGNNISTLVAANPDGADAKSTADNHLRGIKSVLLAQFPALTAPVTASHTELNFVDGVTSAIQGQIDAKGAITGQAWTGPHTFPTQSQGDNSTKAATTEYADTLGATKANKAGDTYTGTHAFAGATSVTVPTPTTATQAATKAYADSLAFSSALPAQTGNAGKFVTTDGTTASWASAAPGDHEVFVTTGNGFGSTNTRIRRFTTTQLSVGTDITYTDSATLGASFTINTTGIYGIQYSDSSSLGQAIHGISVNSNQLTTGYTSITAAHAIAGVYANTGLNVAAVATVKLTAGDVVRPHSQDSTQNNPGPSSSYFRVRKLGSI